jgi:hypothetical protein
MIEELYETRKKRKGGLLERLVSFTAKTGGAGIGATLGMYGSVPYAVGKEVCSIFLNNQIYPLQNLALESLALIGSCALLGRGAVWYFSKWFK